MNRMPVPGLHVLSAAHAKGLALYFGGDVVAPGRLPPATVALHAPRHVAHLLRAKFLGAYSVAIVSPACYSSDGFACYSNLLDATAATGEPLGYQGAGFRAAQALWALLTAAHVLAQPGAGTAQPCPPVQLLGFSKGGAVLNQLLAELAQLQDDTCGQAEQCCVCTLEAGGGPSSATAAGQGRAGPRTAGACLPLLASIRRLHFLDVGLNTPGAYTTDPWVFCQLAKRCQAHQLGIVLHGTPRQWEDPTRPWIAAEAARMQALAAEAGVRLQRKWYFQGQQPSLKMHFRILEAFDAS